MGGGNIDFGCRSFVLWTSKSVEVVMPPIENQRDKMALLGIILFGILSFITIWILISTEKTEASIIVAMLSQITAIVAVLGAIFRGNPSAPALNTSETTTTEQKSL